MAYKHLTHNPTLESVLMVEKVIKENSQEYGKYQIWKKLPRKMMYQTYQTILDYLQESGKIMVDKDGIVLWTYDPEGIRRLMEDGLILR